MSSKLYLAYNGPMVTTAAPVKVTTGTVIKTLEQLSPPANGAIEVIEWGISFDGFAAAQPGASELVETGAINATVTAFVANDIMRYGQAGGDASRITLGTANSGYTASAEGTITASRQLDLQLLPPTAPYIHQFPLERGPQIQASNFGRVRVTFGTAINALCYVIWQE